MGRASVFHYCGSLTLSQSRCGLRKPAQMAQMPIIEKTVARRIGEHRRFHDLIPEFYAAQRCRSEQQGLSAIFFLDSG
jgi:hypothetical protein